MKASIREQKVKLLEALEALVTNPAWREVVEPALTDLARLEAEAHEDAAKPAAERAEHLWGMKRTRELLHLVPREIARTREFLRKYPE